MGYRLVVTKRAKKDKPKLESHGLWEKTRELLKQIREDPYKKPVEKLVGDFKGAFSKKINIKHRLIYEVNESEKTVKIISMFGHYADNE